MHLFFKNKDENFPPLLEELFSSDFKMGILLLAATWFLACYGEIIVMLGLIFFCDLSWNRIQYSVIWLKSLNVVCIVLEHLQQCKCALSSV